MESDLLATGATYCRGRGYDVSYPDSGADPPGLATPTADARPPFGPARPVALDPVRGTDPTTVLSRVWTNQGRERATLFVVSEAEAAETVTELLTPPVGVRSEDARGCRVFFDGPDRVRLAEGGYAAVPAGDDVEWHEAPSADPESEDKRLELRAGAETLSVLDGVDHLDCPPRESFPYAYERDEDKHIRVRDFLGRPVERYVGVKAMRAGGFAPVAAPLVPEHMFDGPVTDWWGVLVAGEDAVRTGGVRGRKGR
ncbi:hypothetical protein [Candidatus Halobonum tyrrellensis]|uniref:Uncharacterized protein n=1 Tax=Candidatus Halobonum tyrrellensis G22 TaxID=1324957 RepID=V4HB17_9EURY|nr:hypothetical protein [Candidatus Halobonum tyrrellensis]ESP87248.1 hypothetical protein K933_15324 [Candidatus Halobonum tyrrellensis G22]